MSPTQTVPAPRMARSTALALAVLLAAFASGQAAMEPSDEERAAASRLHEGRFESAASSFAFLSKARPGDPEGPMFEALTTWWRLLDNPKDADLVGRLDERLAETLRRSESLLDGPQAQRGRIFAGTALVLTAQTRAFAKKYFSAGSAARKGHAYLQDALAADPNAVDANFALGAYKYYAAKLPWIVKALRVFVAIPGGSVREGLERLQSAAAGARYFRSESLLLLAHIYSSEDDVDLRRALDYLSQAQSLTPDSPLYAAVEARLEFSLGRLNAAEASARRSLSLSEAPPRVAEQIPALARLRLALTLYYQYRPREALEALQPLLADAASLPPESIGTSTGLLNRLMDDLDRAPGSAPAPASDPNPSPPSVPAPRSVPAAPIPRDAGAAEAVEMLRAGRIEEALAALTAAADRNPGDAIVRYQLARALQAAGRTEEAIAALTRVLADGSPTQRTLQGWTMIRLGSALRGIGRGEEADGHLRRAAEIKGFPFARAAEDRLRHPEEKSPPEG